MASKIKRKNNTESTLQSSETVCVKLQKAVIQNGTTKPILRC